MRFLFSWSLEGPAWVLLYCLCVLLELSTTTSLILLMILEECSRGVLTIHSYILSSATDIIKYLFAVFDSVMIESSRMSYMSF
ncbi:hypothetical protein F5879DRAFT_468639 [Lentinula edodes]|nr:hypothetical protein F5879DRAFT_468639 [Lentinula edodes]